MKKIIIILILLLLFLTPIQASTHNSLVSTENMQTQVMDQVQENYTIEIEKNLDFGIISKRDPVISKKLNISLRDVIPNEGAKIEVKLANKDLKMWDEEREHSLSLKASQTRFDFELKDHSQSLDLSINPNYITAAGNYKAVLDFEINYISHQEESLEASPSDWFSYQCSKNLDFCEVSGFSSNILNILESDGVKQPLSIRIPDEFDGIKTKKITASSFKSKGVADPVLIHSLHLPDALSEIEGFAFDSQPLKEVKGGLGLVKIGSYAFRGCELKHIRLKDNVKTIYSYAFDGNPIELVELPLSITSIHGGAFVSKLPSEAEKIIRYYGTGYENNQMNPRIAGYTFTGYKLENNDYD